MEGDEKPVHWVTLSADFWMLDVPVTWAMYRLFDPAHDGARDDFDEKLPREQQEDVPVYRVTWYAATMFAAWIGQIWKGARLPLEPEWEAAARAGTPTRYWNRSAQGKGAGEKMLKYAMRVATQQAASVGCLALLTDAKPEAAGFYQKLGFERAKKRNHCPLAYGWHLR